MSNVPVFTIGYGNRSFGEFAQVLERNAIQYLIDVRSSPYSRHNPDFIRERLRTLLAHEGIRYASMGDTLGGRPRDAACYRNSKVDYQLVSRTEFFRKGIGRLHEAVRQELRVGLMCSEAKPQECHRSKLIGRILTEEGIGVVHLDENGDPKTQAQVIALVQPQHALFATDDGFQSRKRYTIPDQEPEEPRWPRVVTIGAYGFDEEGFFATLRNAGVDTFCDLRLRRGMRGRTYAFVNSNRLPKALEGIGVRYVHCKDLAPDQEIRDRQAEADREARVGKRSRTSLSTGFVEAYTEARLSSFDAARFLRELGPNARTVALFCVERDPEACHRSLVAQRLTRELGLQIDHFTPCVLSSSPRP
jgi:uncharacterized protein (DUF488 family)